ncbi:MAG: 3-oxoacyl-[acyl-carrier-protein] reductase [Pseudonocardiales bacterium]|nr:3-oxoacyl-[acyl-carrier-protein] reductase [Pseudonocardiales bacterium]
MVFDSGPIWELSEERWLAVVDTNLGGVWRTTKAVMPAMISQGGGAIVMISSVNGLEVNPGHGTPHRSTASSG